MKSSMIQFEDFGGLEQKKSLIEMRIAGEKKRETLMLLLFIIIIPS